MGNWYQNAVFYALLFLLGHMIFILQSVLPQAACLAELIYDLFMQIGYYFKYLNCEMSYVADSFPVAICDNIRIAGYKLLKGRQWRGMQRYFYGVKVQLLVTKDGIPVEFGFVPGSENDSLSLKSSQWKYPLKVRW